MKTLTVLFKKLTENAVTPKKAHPTDAGFDLVATGVRLTDEFIEYSTGIALELPDEYVGLLFPRSSVSNYHLNLANSVGVIDAGYRGEIKLRFRQFGEKVYEVGDRIGQLVILPCPSILLVESVSLNNSDRGEGGFGSTGVSIH